jgi:hypothetical protein
MPEIRESSDHTVSGDPLMYALQDSSWRSLLYSGTRATSLSVIDTTVTRYVFSGAYTYSLDVGSGLLARAEAFEQKANLLFGTRITPEVLWNLAPWSWLIDWFGTVGTLLGNLTAFSDDSLVLRYGYLQRHVVGTRLLSSGSPMNFSSGTIGTVSNVLGYESKERWRATPYGFGLNPSLFSAKQWAILAALGMTKAPRTLA